MQSTRADREDRLRTLQHRYPTAVHPATSGELAPGGVAAAVQRPRARAPPPPRGGGGGGIGAPREDR
ncbi:hypothetical protein NKH48_06335, partial [Mesorhizobium sp. M1233]|uniref:hypothetical protein n=1 Tax=Mesorhizobium sp. M1233 TaxID=2957072 RepID=UPI00333DF9B2